MEPSLMTINEALKILLENSDYAQYTNADDIELADIKNKMI